jgi:hypothetical protein
MAVKIGPGRWPFAGIGKVTTSTPGETAMNFSASVVAIILISAVCTALGAEAPKPAAPAVAPDKQEQPQLVRDLRAKLPAGWDCSVNRGEEVKLLLHGLGLPVFQVVIANNNISFALTPDVPDGPKRSPVIPLYFYPQADKASVMKVIDKEQIYSWNVPVYFGETEDFVVVTSPLYVNGGCFTLEARRALGPAWTVVRGLIPNREQTGVDELAADH